jgi:transglutaminase-like putative cysteine protease
MDLQKLLSIVMATLAALGTLLLAMGEQSPWMAMALFLAAVTSLVVTDFAGWFRLGRNGAALLGFGILVFFLYDGFRLAGEARMMALADLLIYLQMVLLFQEKEPRVYWWLAVMSLLQVVVATRFSQGVAFGALLVVYTFVGLIGLSLLTIYGQWHRRRRAKDRPKGDRPIFAASGFTSTPVGDSRAGIGRELFARLGLLGVGTLALSLVIFFTVPRLGQPAWRGSSVSPRQVVGFNDKIMLGELGETLESREEVMRLQLFDPTTGRPYPLRDEVYLRGTAVTQYAHNEWSSEGQSAEKWTSPRSPWSPEPPVPQSKSAVMQRITIEPSDRDDLFYVWPLVTPLRDRGSRYLLFDPQTERLYRKAGLGGERLTFKAKTHGLADGRQLSLAPSRNPVATPPLLQMPKLPRLTALARQWVAESRLPSGRAYEIAKLLERQLSSSGRFRYSLQGEERDLSIDAIEDFVSNHPRGHCEYFATALAMMLRSQGIPSRVILGYRCDEWNEVGKFFQVRQLHAHAWVEAYLRPGQVPPGQDDGDDETDWTFGGWLRLDATPGAEVGSAAADRSLLGQWGNRMHRLQSAWDDYIVEMDQQRQKDAVYQPLVRTVQESLAKLRDSQWWRGLFGRIAAALHADALGGLAGWLIGVTALVVLGLLLVGPGRRAWRIGRRFWRQLTGNAAAPQFRTRSSVDFYRRFEHLLSRHGLLRAVGQTPREFALAAGSQLVQRSGRTELATLAVEVVEVFYRVRFGGQTLDPLGVQAMEHALERFSDAAQGSPQRPRVSQAAICDVRSRLPPGEG